MNVMASFFYDQLHEQQADIAAAISQRIPGQGPKGRRSGAYSHHSRVKILMRTNALRHVARGSGSRLSAALRPGMR